MPSMLWWFFVRALAGKFRTSFYAPVSSLPYSYPSLSAIHQSLKLSRIGMNLEIGSLFRDAADREGVRGNHPSPVGPMCGHVFAMLQCHAMKVRLPHIIIGNANGNSSILRMVCHSWIGIQLCRKLLQKQICSRSVVNLRVKVNKF